MEKTKMHQRIRLCWIFYLFIIFFNTTVHAQIKIHKSLGVEDGLVQSQVMCIYEDRNGYLWFGTVGGLSRWDGINFVNFQTQDGLAVAQVYSIYEGKDGTIYFGTYGGGVSLYKDGRFERLNEEMGLANNIVNFIYQGTDDGLYFGTDGGVSLYKNGKFKTLNEKMGLANNAVNCIYEDRNGTIYFGTHSGVSFYKDNKFETLNKEDGLVNNVVLSIYEGKNGIIYFGTYGGVSLYIDGKFKTLNEEMGLANNLVTSIYESKDGIVYFGTFGGGVSLYKDGKFETLNEENGLANDRVWSIYEGKDGTIYFGTDAGGVSIYKHDKFKTLNEETGLANNIVMAIYQDKEGTMYFGTYGSGVTSYRDGNFETLNKKNGLADNNIWSIYKGKDGTIYFGTDRGPSLYKNGNFESFSNKNELTNITISSIYESKNGALYFGTDGNGVIVYNNGNFGTLNKENGLANNIVWSIYEGKDKTLYFGTDAGLSLYKNEKFKKIDVSHGLSNNSVYGILEDDEGKIYLSTNKGINVLDFSKGDLSIRTLRYNDGLASDECNQGACYKTSKGLLWFGTARGVTRYNPQKDKPNTNPPKIHITRTRLFEEDIRLDKTEFDHDENYFKFDYIGIYLPAPEKVVYKYKLSNVDLNWVTSKQRFVQYTNLDDGDYVFEVKAMNEWGYWSKPTHLSFTIFPPWWETWWFYLLFAGFLVFTLVFSYQQKIKRVLEIEHIKISEKERIRKKAATDFHDELGHKLTKISLHSELAKRNLETSPPDVIEYLEKISDNSISLHDDMKNFIWTLDPEKDSLYEVALYLKDFGDELFDKTNIDFQVKGISKRLETLELSMDFRRHITLIFKEGMNNILKHAECQNAILEFAKKDKILEITLSDDGKGFNKSKSSYGNGLKNMKNRADKIASKLDISSKIGDKTTIRFTGQIPILGD